MCLKCKASLVGEVSSIWGSCDQKGALGIWEGLGSRHLLRSEEPVFCDSMLDSVRLSQSLEEAKRKLSHGKCVPEQ